MSKIDDKDKTTLEIVQEIVAEQLNINPNRVTPDANFTEDLGADSLDVVELVMSVEERFDIEIEDIVAAKLLKLKTFWNTLLN